MRENYTNDYTIAAHHKDDHSAVRVGPSRPDRSAWNKPYEYTSGCGSFGWPPADRDKHGQALLNEAAGLMFMGVDPKQILQEFAKIEAWRELRNIQTAGDCADRAFMPGKTEWNPHNPEPPHNSDL